MELIFIIGYVLGCVLSDMCKDIHISLDMFKLKGKIHAQFIDK